MGRGQRLLCELCGKPLGAFRRVWWYGWRKVCFDKVCLRKAQAEARHNLSPVEGS
jgi:hypothetical protein